VIGRFPDLNESDCKNIFRRFRAGPGDVIIP
jgi:hypothetical protein